MGDIEAARQMLLSQLADVILMHRDLVISDLKAVGANVSQNMSSKDLAKLSIENLDNPKFQRLITETIIHHQEVHGLRASGQFDGIVSLGGEDLNLGADGQGGTWMNAADPVSAVADSVSAIFNFASKKGDKKIAQSQIDAEKERSKQEMIKLLASKQQGKNVKHVMSPFAILGIVLGSIVVIGAIGFTVYKMRKKANT